MDAPSSHKKGLSSALSVALLCLLIVGISTYLINLLLARLLNPIQYGDFSVAIRIIGFCSLVALLGADRAVLKVMPDSIQLKKWHHAKGYFRWGLRLIFISSAIIILIILAVVGLLALFNKLGFIHLDYRHPTLAVIWLIPFVATSLFLSKVLMSRGHISMALLPHKMVRPAIALLGVFLLVSLTGFANVYHALFIYGVASVAIIAVLIFVVYRKLPEQVKRANPKIKHKMWLQFSIQLMIIKVIPLAVSISELILIEVIATNEADVGIFSAIIALLLFVWLSYKALIVVISPKISTAINSGGIGAFKKQLMRITWYHVLFSGIVTLFLVIYAKSLLSFFGPAYLAGTYPLVIMALGDFVANSFRASELFLQYGGYPKTVSKIVVFSFCLGIALTGILIAYYGLMGAATGYVATRFIQSFVSTFWCVRRLKIMPLV